MTPDVDAESLTSTTWGMRVKLERTRRGWTQADLAQAAGVSQRVISYLERGDTALRDQRRIAIARALGLRTAELFPYADELDPGVAGGNTDGHAVTDPADQLARSA